MPAEKIGVFSAVTAREILRRTHIQSSSAPSEGLAGPDGHATWAQELKKGTELAEEGRSSEVADLSHY